MWYVYKITNLINSKYYIGVHNTVNIDDGYMGCGHYKGRKLRENLDTGLYRAFRKYGDEAFNKQILFAFSTSLEAYQKEKELVDVNDPFCYNSKPGGIGGFPKNINVGRSHTDTSRKNMSKSAIERSARIPLQTDILVEYNKNKKGKTYVEIYGEEKAREIINKKSNSAKGKKHSYGAREKMSINRKGKDCGKCKGRKRVYDTINNKFVRLFPEQIQLLIQEGKIKEEDICITKFLKAKYILTSC